MTGEFEPHSAYVSELNNNASNVFYSGYSNRVLLRRTKTTEETFDGNGKVTSRTVVKDEEFGPGNVYPSYPGFTISSSGAGYITKNDNTKE